MTVTVKIIQDRLPEFCKLDKSVLALMLAAAEGCINRAAWGENRADEATIYLTGHLLTARKEGSGLAAGPVSQMREGPLSVTFMVGGKFAESVYGSTSYGRHYLELRSTVIAPRFC